MTDYRPRRVATRFPITLIGDDGAVEVTLRDISIDGARCEVESPMLAGSAVTVRIGPSTLPALVQWTRKGSIGLRFMQRPDPLLISLIPRDDG